MSRPRKYPIELRAEAKRLRDERMTYSQIAAAIGVSRKLVGEFLRVPRRRQSNRKGVEINAERNRRIMELVEGGQHSYGAIGRILGIAGTTVARVAGPAPIPNWRLPHVVEAINADLIAGTKTLRQIAAEHGASTDAVRGINRKFRPGQSRKPPPPRVPDIREGVIAMRRDKVMVKDIAAHFGTSLTTVGKILALARLDDPSIPLRRALSEQEAEERRVRAVEKRREARQRRRAMEAAAKPKPPARLPMPPRSVVHVEPPRINRTAEQDMIAAAIKAGVGKRFEFISAGKASQADNIRTGADAVAHLEGLGFTVDKRIRKAYTRYQVSGGSSLDSMGWMRPQQFVHAVKAMLVGSTYRAVPLRDTYASQQIGA